MIADDLRLALVEAVSKIPLAVDQVGRTSLLAGIPQAEFLTRNSSNSRGDVMVLVLQLEETYGPAREWRLLQLIDNAAASVAGTDLAKQLAQIRRSLLEAARPRHPKPAETAQVHLFDLRQPVMMCVGQLPPTGGISGFVVPAATPRLLRVLLRQPPASWRRIRCVDARSCRRDAISRGHRAPEDGDLRRAHSSQEGRTTPRAEARCLAGVYRERRGCPCAVAGVLRARCQPYRSLSIRISGPGCSAFGVNRITSWLCSNSRE